MDKDTFSTITKAFGEAFKAVIMAVITIAVIGSYLYMGWLIMSGKAQGIDPQSALQEGQFIGNLQGFAATVMGFYFGSTYANKDKDRAMANMSGQPQTTVVPTSPNQTTEIKQ